MSSGTRNHTGVVSVIVLLLGGCSTGSGGSADGLVADTIDAAEVTEALDAGTDGPRADGAKVSRQLEFVDPLDDAGHSTAGATTFELSLGYHQTRPLKVRCLEDGVPAEGVPISFVVEDDPKGYGAVSPKVAATGADGVASAQVEDTHATILLYRVRVCIEGVPDAACLVFEVNVHPVCLLASLAVAFAPYDGLYASELTNAEVRIFRQDAEGQPKCADLPVDSLPPETVVSSTLSSLSQMAMFPELPNLETEKKQTYTIVGLAKNDPGTILAWACDDAQGVVEWSAMTVATLTLHDLPAPVPPRLANAYDVTSTVDLVSGPGSPVGDIVQNVQNLLSDPGFETLRLFCTADLGNPAQQAFCSGLFDDPASPDQGHLTALGQAVLDLLDPPSVVTVPVLGAMTDLLSSVRLLSKLAFACDPDDAPATDPGCAEEKWHAVVLRWSVGTGCGPNDSYCGDYLFELGQVPGMAGIVVTHPDAGVSDGALSIAEHPVDIRVDALVALALEKVLLPNVLGDGTDGLPVVDAFDRMLGATLGGGRACLADGSCCAAFATAVSTMAVAVEPAEVQQACDALLASGPRYLLGRIEVIDGGPEGMRLGTQAACLLSDNDLDATYEALGSEALPCAWSATAWYGLAEYPVPATFWGRKP